MAEDDLSPKMPAIKKRTKILDPYRPLIISWLEGDRGEWRKQRRTAHRVWVRLTTEEGVEVGESTVRAYVRTLREELGHSDADDYLDRRWVPSAHYRAVRRVRGPLQLRVLVLRPECGP